MSTNSIVVGMSVVTLAIWASGSSRASGTVTMPRFGSMRTGDGVKERGLPDVGQADDSSF
jgi:hypothetical protein